MRMRAWVVLVLATDSAARREVGFDRMSMGVFISLRSAPRHLLGMHPRLQSIRAGPQVFVERVVFSSS